MISTLLRRYEGTLRSPRLDRRRDSSVAGAANVAVKVLAVSEKPLTVGDQCGAEGQSHVLVPGLRTWEKPARGRQMAPKPGSAIQLSAGKIVA